MSTKTPIANWLRGWLRAPVPPTAVLPGRPGLLAAPVSALSPRRLRRGARVLVGGVALALGASGGLVATTVAAAFAGSGAPTISSNTGAPDGDFVVRVPNMALPAFPDANVTYPNGSIVEFSGANYVFAGGHPFAVTTPHVLYELQAVDGARIVPAVAGAAVPTAAPRPGTVITTFAINGNAPLYVVGTDGQLHAFSTLKQALGDGYDPSVVVNVPTLGGLTVGATADVDGSAVEALSTSADGALVDSSNAYYVFDGDRAFPIPTPVALSTVEKSDPADILSGTVGASQTGATFTTGALLTVNGIIYVGEAGDLFPFATLKQFIADGYGGTPSIVSPNLGGLTVVTNYTGS